MNKTAYLHLMKRAADAQDNTSFWDTASNVWDQTKDFGTKAGTAVWNNMKANPEAYATVLSALLGSIIAGKDHRAAGALMGTGLGLAGSGVYRGWKAMQDATRGADSEASV